jgi:hypothetical protein
MTHVSTICLCGSTRFLKEFEEANVELTKRGFAVITISMAMPRQPDGTHAENALKETLDLVHLLKIVRSDAILIVGDGYIGRSTAREIIWTGMLGKPIFWRAQLVSWDDAAIVMRHPVHADGHGGVSHARAILERL